ncbi:hypothetical protein [Agaribacter marinus]|uniref:Alginate export domain-containing protein n=1 Tax=Agaribacter marinus TaxID=1431249 RepID=A0AA37SZL3_9ALTE|nr:hypothetical protein [Agaribacter marinus]GLR72172.1 hypothetical protein GCM10007852_30800 [Agaribacter marinus]
MKLTLSLFIFIYITPHLFGCATLAFANEWDVSPTARYRYLQVNDEQRGDATANTIKLRINAKWDSENALSAFGQFDHVYVYDEDSYNSVAVQRPTSPIPDVASTEVNQAWINYTSNNDWQVKIGRQVINLNNERHVSSVEFWQNDQSFDAFSFTYNDAIHWDISYQYISKVHRIFGDDAELTLSTDDSRFPDITRRPSSELGNHSHNTHLLNVTYNVNQFLELSSYAHLIKNESASIFSSDTYGLRITGEVKPSTIKYGYTADIAHQRTSDDNPWDYSGYYAFAEVSAQFNSHKFAIAHERLSEDNGFAFATSLGNNHKFLGWADVFTSYTNADGIRDSFVTYRGRKAKLRWRLVGHHFESDTTGKTAGKEIDLEVAYRFTRKWEATLLASKYFSKGGIEGIKASEGDLSTWMVSLSYNI